MRTGAGRGPPAARPPPGRAPHPGPLLLRGPPARVGEGGRALGSTVAFVGLSQRNSTLGAQRLAPRANRRIRPAVWAGFSTFGEWPAPGIILIRAPGTSS